MTNHRKTASVVVGLGELLWDLLPDGPRLGGAPANFAVTAGRLGDHAVVASRVGDDELGRRACAVLGELPVDLSYLQRDKELPTGSVTVHIEDGEPHYTIHEPVAWDRLMLTDAWLDLARRADALCFGTLAQRSSASQEAILGFLDATRPSCVRVFDVNLRPPFWSTEVLVHSLGRATILKLNAGELPRVLRATGVCPWAVPAQSEGEILSDAHRLIDRYPIALVCITLGREGSLLVSREDCHRHPGHVTVVRDTVGAGDAFTAALTHHYLQGAPLSELNEAGNRWGSWVASQSGGMPPLAA